MVGEERERQWLMGGGSRACEGRAASSHARYYDEGGGRDRGVEVDVRRVSREMGSRLSVL